MLVDREKVLRAEVYVSDVNLAISDGSRGLSDAQFRQF